MPTYVQLLRFTEKGLAAIKEGPSRVEAGKQAVESLGGEVKGWYLLMGQYDAVWIVELPNDEAATKLALRFGALGTVRTETLRAYTLEETRALIDAVT